jgi:hypothetical protein
MKKAECLERNAKYHAYAQSVEVHQKPTEGVNSGAHGNDFERQIKMAMGNYRFNGVANAKQADTTKRLHGANIRFEIKSGCGELIRYNRDGECVGDIRNSDYIIYCPEYDINRPAQEQAYIFPATMFFNLMLKNGMLREKKSSNMMKQPKELQFYDRITIQSFNNSKKKTALMYELMKEGVPLNVFIEVMGL